LPLASNFMIGSSVEPRQLFAAQRSNVQRLLPVTSWSERSCRRARRDHAMIEMLPRPADSPIARLHQFHDQAEGLLRPFSGRLLMRHPIPVTPTVAIHLFYRYAPEFRSLGGNVARVLPS